MIIQNSCKNCAAPLNLSLEKCEYCGSFFRFVEPLSLLPPVTFHDRYLDENYLKKPERRKNRIYEDLFPKLINSLLSSARSII